MGAQESRHKAQFASRHGDGVLLLLFFDTAKIFRAGVSFGALFDIFDHNNDATTRKSHSTHSTDSSEKARGSDVATEGIYFVAECRLQ